jgi:hypothetical protein
LPRSGDFFESGAISPHHSRCENDGVEDFIVGSFDCGGASCGREMLRHEDPGGDVKGEDFGGGRVSEGGLVGLEERFDCFSVG